MHINQTKQNYIYITVCVWMWYWTVCSPAPGQQQKWESAAACCDGAAVWPQEAVLHTPHSLCKYLPEHEPLMLRSARHTHKLKEVMFDN